MKLIIICLSLILISFLATPVATAADDSDAEEYNNAIKAYNAGDYTTTLTIIKPLAEKGYANAQYQLGVMYDNGTGVERDYLEAFKWHALSAKQGNADAQYNLGFSYHFSKGVKANYLEAIKWYTQAANQGHIDAQFSLGMIYGGFGDGEKQDSILAYAWYNIAMMNRHKQAKKFQDKLKLKMTPSQVVEAEAKAEELKKSIKLNN